MLLRLFYPVSGLYRLIREDDGLQADFMATIHGVNSFAPLRASANEINFRWLSASGSEPLRNREEQARSGTSARPRRLGYSGSKPP
jgi:hypothetical protein